MQIVREPRLRPIAIYELHPTQITVGMREVRAKRKSWRDAGHKARFLGKHLIPVIHGYKDRYYVIDHHHLTRALYEEGVRHIAILVVADLRKLEKEAFWTYLDNRGWLHPYDARGRRRPYTELPRRVTELIDDPYRSLAGELRRAGGFAKDTASYSEFLWADFLRRRIKRSRVVDNFTQTLEVALRLAKSEDADYLPGWCGPVPRETGPVRGARGRPSAAD
ncbi:MAG TPA: ParB-like protein [Steroidobacteraceae bacterium]|nr:ParB-like protein [Steroidobacteraceae bacterium]